MICIVSGGGVVRFYEGVLRFAIFSDGDGFLKVVWIIISVRLFNNMFIEKLLCLFFINLKV